MTPERSGSMLKVLLIGDVVGGPGRKFLRERLPGLKKRLGADAAVVNGENAAGGSGITAAIAQELFDSGADAITLGDHTYGQKQFAAEIPRLERVVRPANYPREAPGRGWCMVSTSLYRFAVVNLQGRVFMGPCECPFHAADAALAEIPRDIPVLVDFHAEATSEKISLAYHLDGRVAAVAGTHTHVQTSDARVLEKGTAFISDLGMTGPYISSLGREIKPVLQKFISNVPAKFEVAGGPCTIEGALVTIDAAKGSAVSIEAVRERQDAGGVPS